MDIAIRHHHNVCVLQVSGRIDTLTAKSFGEQLSGLIGRGALRLVLDLTRVSYISSAGFRSLLVTARVIEAAEGRLALAGVNGEIKRLFDIAALTEFFPMWPTADEAASHIGPSPAGSRNTGTGEGTR